MAAISITLTEDQLERILDAYRTIQEFLASVLSPNELYQAAFLTGLQEAHEDIDRGNLKEIRSFDDFVS